MLCTIIARLAKKDMVLVAELLIELGHQVVKGIVIQVVATAWKEKVIGTVWGTRRGRIRLREIAQHFGGDRVDPILRNDVSGEGRARHRAIGVDLGGGGIVDGDLAALRIGEFAEIAGQPLRLGHRKRQRCRRAFAIAFVVDEEKAPVPSVIDLWEDDRPAERAAVLVQKMDGLGNARRVVLKRIRVQRVAPHELVCRSVELVRATL